MAYRAITLPGIRLPGCIDPKTMEVVKQTDLHNLREQMHALYALYRYRGNEKAKVMALEMIDTLDAFFDDTTGQLDEDAFRHATGGQILKWPGMNPDYPFPLTFGRYIGPLVKFYRATGESRALAQALRLKQFCFQHVLNQRGDYSAWRFGNHTHSTTAMISSLAQLMDVTRDIEILQRIQAFMDRGLKEIALDFGWCIENYNRSDNVGEINNTADILETCLILGKWGIPGMYARGRTHFARGTCFRPNYWIPVLFQKTKMSPTQHDTICPPGPKALSGSPAPMVTRIIPAPIFHSIGILWAEPWVDYAKPSAHNLRWMGHCSASICSSTDSILSLPLKALMAVTEWPRSPSCAKAFPHGCAFPPASPIGT